jgi:hypothetical protein
MESGASSGSEARGFLKVYLRIEGETAERFLRIKDYLGLKKDTEVLRALINFYWREKKEEFEFSRKPSEAQPLLEHFNVCEDGVLVLDRSLANSVSKGRIVDVRLRPEGAWCEYRGSRDCRHAGFVLGIPEVREILRRKERK